jgi:uncharacterized protein (DUF1800 family)
MSTTTIKERMHSPCVVAGLTPYTGVFEKEQITHLLKRTLFGAKKADIDFFIGKTLAETINMLLTEPPTLADAQLPLRNYAEDTLPMGETWVYAQHNVDFDGQRRNSLKMWWVGNMVNQPRSIFEKMVLFWHNHFATGMLDSFSSMSFEHVLLLRKYALGNFKNLTKDVTLDANMLLYLNGFLNKKSAPDENYARELQELFTLGKGPNAQYTEADVKAAARVLTGWTYSRAQVENPVGSGKYYWKVAVALREHDTDAKQFSAFYDNKVITNTANTDGGALKELDDMLDMIFAKEEVALYICRRIYRFFVYYEIDETIESEIIKPLAVLFRQANYEIKPVLKALFSSEHFFETGLKACLIKSPLENVVGFAREFDIPLPTIKTSPATEVRAVYNAWNNLVANASLQSQYIGDPPNVAGWPAYYQEPGFHENWINTDTFAKRLVFSDTALLTGRSGVLVDVLKFTDQFGTDAEDPNTLITTVLEILYRVPPTDAMLSYLKTTILLDGQASDHYWTEAWLAYKTNPTTVNTATVKTRLQQFYLFITRNPEYQLI